MGELSIKVSIANRVYPLTIKREEEESIRKAAKLLNESIENLESNYAVRDKQDLLAMAALEYASQALSSSSELAVNEIQKEWSQELEVLDKKLGEYLKSV